MKSWLAFAIGGLLVGVAATAVYQKAFSNPEATEVATASPVPAAAEQPAPEPVVPPSTPPAQSPSPLGDPAPTPRRQTPRQAPPQASAPAAAPAPAAPTPIVLPSPAPDPPATQPETPAPQPVAPQEPTPPPPPPRVAKTVTIAEGTLVPVRVGERISTETHKPGDSFTGTLDQPLVVDGFVIAERGSRVDGTVLQSIAAGRVKGLAQLEVGLTQLTTADGQKIRIKTADFIKEGEKSTRDDATKVGIGAAIGTAIGAIAGGGKGAAIGAAAGAGAGTGAVLATRGKAAEIPVETRLTFRLAEAVKITERLK